MSLIYTEGFECVDLAGINEKYIDTDDAYIYHNRITRDFSFDPAGSTSIYNTVGGTTDTVAILRGEGRVGGDCLRCYNLYNFNGHSWYIDPRVAFNDEVYFGFAYKNMSSTESAFDKILITITGYYVLPASGTITVMSITLTRSSTSWGVKPTVPIYEGVTYPTFTTKTLADRTSNEWRYLQFGIKWPSGAVADGSVTVKSIGDSVTWEDMYTAPWATGKKANYNIRSVKISFVTTNTSLAHDIYLDDIYMCTNEGSGPANTFLGAVKVQPIRPIEDVDGYKDWAPSEGLDHYTMVNEEYIAFDSGEYATAGDTGDETYLGTNTDEAKELFTFNELDITGVGYSANILGVALHVSARAVDNTGIEAHLRGISLKSGEVLQEHSDMGIVRQSTYNRQIYGSYRQFFDRDPITDAAFTQDGLYQTRFGVKLEQTVT